MGRPHGGPANTPHPLAFIAPSVGSRLPRPFLTPSLAPSFPALRRAICSTRCIGRLGCAPSCPPLTQLRSLLLRQAQVLVRRGLTFLIHDFRSTHGILNAPFVDDLPRLCVSWPHIDLTSSLLPTLFSHPAFVFSPTFFE